MRQQIPKYQVNVPHKRYHIEARKGEGSLKEISGPICEETIFIEETLRDAEGNPYYQLVYLPESVEDGILFMLAAAPHTDNRLDMWTQSWTNTSSGYAPMAYREIDSLNVISRIG